MNVDANEGVSWKARDLWSAPVERSSHEMQELDGVWSKIGGCKAPVQSRCCPRAAPCQGAEHVTAGLAGGLPSADVRSVCTRGLAGATDQGHDPGRPTARSATSAACTVPLGLLVEATLSLAGWVQRRLPRMKTSTRIQLPMHLFWYVTRNFTAWMRDQPVVLAKSGCYCACAWLRVEIEMNMPLWQCMQRSAAPALVCRRALASCSRIISRGACMPAQQKLQMTAAEA